MQTHRNLHSSRLSVLALLLLLPANLAVARKAKSLSMFHVMDTGYNGITKGAACKAANEVALAAVNARDDILPGYNLQFDYFDEQDGSVVPTGLFHYLLNFETTHEAGMNFAPIILGQHYSPGCNPMARLVHHLNMLGITSGCGDPLLTGDKIDYPNFYRGFIANEYWIFPQFSLMKMAGWKKIAILTWSANRSNYKVAEVMQQVASKAGIEVVHFDSSVAITDDEIDQLKASDARIITYQGNVAPLVLTLLCKSYLVGIRGPKYAFIIWSVPLTDFTEYPSSVLPLPRPCTMDILKAQWAISFWAGPPYESVSGNHGLTALGYDLLGFETLFNNYTNNTVKSDQPNRFMCHDTALEAILVLDGAERLLQSQYNATLSDYSTNPNLVVNALSNVLQTMQFNTLAFGPISYDSRGEFDHIPQYLMQTFDTGHVKLVGIESWDNVKYSWSEFEPGDISYHQVNPIIWTTPDGKPAKDFPGNVILEDSISAPVFGIIVAIAGAGSVAHVVAGFAAKPVSRSGPGASMIKSFITLACLFLNTAASLFVVNLDGSNSPEILCYFQRLFLVAGQSMLSGCFAGIMSRMFQLVTKQKIHLSRRKVHPSSVTDAPNLSISAAGRRHGNHVYIGIFCMAVVTINMIILAVWFGFAPLAVSHMAINHVYFDEVLDAYVQVKVYQCTSDHSVEFTIVLIVINFLINAMASCFALGSRKYDGQVAGFPLFAAEVRLVRYASWNGTMLFLLTVFIVTIMGLRFGPVEQSIALAALILAISLTTGAIIAVPMAVQSRSTDANKSSVVSIEASFRSVQERVSATIVSGIILRASEEARA